jgi:hypothetical protein
VRVIYLSEGGIHAPLKSADSRLRYDVVAAMNLSIGAGARQHGLTSSRSPPVPRLNGLARRLAVLDIGHFRTLEAMSKCSQSPNKSRDTIAPQLISSIVAARASTISTTACFRMCVVKLQ